MNESLISRDESRAIKGLLMLLILYGHCHLLVEYPKDHSIGIFEVKWWIYLFHVYGYFILPFVYGCKKLNVLGYLHEMKRSAVKLFVPYFWFSILCIFINIFIMHKNFRILDVFLAMISGSEKLSKQAFGFYFLWFIPMLFNVQLLERIYFNISNRVKALFEFIGLLLSVFLVLNIWPNDSTSPVLNAYLTLGLITFQGIVVRKIILYNLKKLRRTTSFCQKKIWLATFIIVSACFFLKDEYAKVYSSEITRLLKIVMPIFFFMVVYSFRNYLVKSRLLMLVGKYSFPFYLIHIIIYQVLAQIIHNGTIPGNYGIGLLLYVLTLMIGLGLSSLMLNIRILNKILFPSIK